MTPDILNSTLNARNNRDAYIRQIAGTVANRVFKRREGPTRSHA